MASFPHSKESLRKEIPSGYIKDNRYSDNICLVLPGWKLPVYLLYQREKGKEKREVGNEFWNSSLGNFQGGL